MRALVLTVALSAMAGCGSGPATYPYGKDHVFDDPHLNELMYKWNEEDE